MRCDSAADPTTDLTNGFVKLERQLRAVSSWLPIVGAIVFALLITADRAKLRGLGVELPHGWVAITDACKSLLDYDVCPFVTPAREDHDYESATTAFDDRPTIASGDVDDNDMPLYPVVCGISPRFETTPAKAPVPDETEGGRYPCRFAPNQAACLELELRALVEAHLLGYPEAMFRDIIARRPAELHAFARRLSGYDDRGLMLSASASRAEVR